MKAQKRKEGEGEGEGEGDDDDEYKGLIDAACKIYKNEGGLGGLYTGVLQDTGKTVADSFLFFLGYTFLRQMRQRQLQQRSLSSTGKQGKQILPIMDELTVGFLAGSAAKLFTTPIANIVTRKQTSALFSKDKGKGLSTSEIAGQIRAEKGIKGFWAGYPASLVLTLNPSITFFLYELFKNTLLPRSKREKPSPGATFILAALSKVIASSITYPFSLAKTQAQAQAGSKDKGKESEKDGKEVKSRGLSIFGSLLEIVRADGVGGLYAGLSGDVLKGFFNHGITMLVKDLVYRVIVQAYYLFLIALRRYPSPEELAERAREQAEEFAHSAKENATDAAEKVKEKGEDVVSGAVEGGKKAAKSLGDTRDETVELMRDYVEDEAQEWKGVYSWFWEKVKFPGQDS